MSEITQKRQLAAIMFTDIVGYTALMGEDEDKAFALLKRNREIQKPLIEKHNGKWIKEIGDGVLATFSTVSDSVYCAIAIQQESKSEPGLSLRIGIHQGEVVFQNDDVFGDGVNIASRLESLAPAGGILVSEAVKGNIQNKQGLQTMFVKEEQLKNIKELVKIYAIKAENITLPEPGKISRSTDPIKSKSSNKGIYLALAIFLLAILSYWGYTTIYSSPPTEKENVTIAVLAFDDQSPIGDQEWLGDGMADEILNVLANVNGLQVTGKTSSFSFKGKGLTTKVIGETLNVTTVLEGSVSKIGDKLRITAQLIDVETDAHIWSKKYDRDAADIFDIVDEVAQSIANSLKVQLSLEQLDELRVEYTVDPEAYEYYLKGKHYTLNKFINTGSDIDLKQAEKMYLKAIAIDSTYADAYSGLANLYDAKAWSDTRYNKKRDSLVNIAYTINPNSAMVLVSKGLRFRKPDTFNLDSTFYYYKRAYTLDPKSSVINTSIFMLYWQIGLYENSIYVGSKIIKSDPFYLLIRARLVRSLMGIGQIEKAKEENLKLLEIDSDYFIGNWNMLYLALFYDKDKEDAALRIEKMKSIVSESSIHRYESLALAFDGKKEESLNLDNSLYTYSLLDMKEEGMRRFSLINTEKENLAYANYLDYLNDKKLDFIRDDPKFKQILAEKKKVYEKRVAKYGHLFDEE